MSVTIVYIEHTSQVIAKFVLEIYMITKLGICAIYAKYLIDFMEEVYIHLCATYEVTAINHVKWALYTYLTYITEQKRFPQCTFVFHQLLL